MLIIPWYLCPSLGGVFSRAWRGGRRRQTLSTAQSVLLRGTVNSQRTNSSLSPSPWQSSAWDTPLLAAEAEEKLPGGFCSSGGHRDHLTVLSPKHEVAEELPEMLEEQPNTTGLVIISVSVLHLHNTPKTSARILISRRKISMTSVKPAGVPVLDFTDKG